MFKIALAVLATALVTASSTLAAVSHHWITVRSGDAIKTKNQKVICGVFHYAGGTITCSPSPNSGNVSVSTSKLGVSLVVNGKAMYTCLSDGYCESGS